MRLICSEKVRKLREEIKPYLSHDPLHHPGVVDDAPEEIKRKFEEWKRLYHEEYEAAERINQA
jgi:hypothetical protein